MAQCVLQSSIRIYSSDLPSFLVDVYLITITTVAAIYGIRSGHKYLTNDRKKSSKFKFPNHHGISPYLISMPDPKEPNGKNTKYKTGDNEKSTDPGLLYGISLDSFHPDSIGLLDSLD